MSPPPLSAALLLLLLLPCLATLLSPAQAAADGPAHHRCYPSPKAPDEPQPCPHPSFPFSVYPGCGHPAFQIRCSARRSLMSINRFEFLLLDRRRDSLLVSPYTDQPAAPSPSPDGACGASRLPARQIDLSGSPFRVSEDSCADLAAIRPCRPEHVDAPPNCSGGGGPSDWQRRILSRPLLLLKGCNASYYRHPDPSGVGGADCKPDVAAAVASFLRSGIRIEWYAAEDGYFSHCASCQRKFRGDAACGFNDSDPALPFLCLASDPGPPHLPGSDGHRNPNRVVLLTTALFAFTCLFVLALSAAAIFRRGWGSGDRHLESREDPMTSFLRRYHLQLHPPVFTYDQLWTSTGGFDPKQKIGDGGFGSVYLAQLEDGRAAAVKRLHRHHPAATTKSFFNEILILSSIHHSNLVRLHGYCCDPRGLLLVYDYVPNGTLADHLHGPRSLYKKVALTWALRVDVALQTALALEYLHFSVNPPVVHRDITSSNIFVDKDMGIKVGDFGLSRLLCLPDPGSCPSGSSSSDYVCTGPQGTPGYLDPEYHRSFRLTEKSDVYSFGVVLLELVTGMKAVDLGRDKQEVSLANLVVSRIQIGALHQVVDPALPREGPVMRTVEAMAELAFRCVAGDKDDRPDARELVSELRRIQSRMQDDSKGS
uniref:Putative serine/threonine-protein kinase At1g18390 n=1 Tax=Anthurium amnicola TaxID=1678845 RepID=A0A1D1Z8Y3_9ARAE